MRFVGPRELSMTRIFFYLPQVAILFDFHQGRSPLRPIVLYLDIWGKNDRGREFVVRPSSSTFEEAHGPVALDGRLTDNDRRVMPTR